MRSSALRRGLMRLGRSSLPVMQSLALCCKFLGGRLRHGLRVPQPLPPPPLLFHPSEFRKPTCALVTAFSLTSMHSLDAPNASLDAPPLPRRTGCGAAASDVSPPSASFAVILLASVDGLSASPSSNSSTCQMVPASATSSFSILCVCQSNMKQREHMLNHLRARHGASGPCMLRICRRCPAKPRHHSAPCAPA